jgi:predicted N-acetyltransferase YhbS
MEQADLAAAHQLSAVEGWPHRPSDWSLMFDLGAGAVLETGEGRIVGTAMWWDWGGRAATLGMVIVAPDWQRRGLGRRLTGHALRVLDGRAVLLHATEAGLDLYRTLGFTPVGKVEQWQGEIDRPESYAALAPRGVDVAECPALDAAAFGAPRQNLIQKVVANGVVFADTTGLAVRRRFGRGWHIGPLLERDAGGSETVLRAAIATGFNRIDLLEPSQSLRLVAHGLGLTHVANAVAMIRGD